jgi:hypothetical protein
MKKLYRSFQGKEVDMDQLLQKNETMPAVGNVRVNARGDELGPDGKIIRTKEDILSEYYDNNPGIVDDAELAMSKVRIQSRKSIPSNEEIEPPVRIKSKDSK